MAILWTRTTCGSNQSNTEVTVLDNLHSGYWELTSQLVKAWTTSLSYVFIIRVSPLHRWRAVELALEMHFFASGGKKSQFYEVCTRDEARKKKNRQILTARLHQCRFMEENTNYTQIMLHLNSRRCVLASPYLFAGVVIPATCTLSEHLSGPRAPQLII